MEMDKFSISDLEAYTDIKAATLRIWEKRYKLIEPKRTETNIRYYTAEDLQLLLAVSALQKRGIKISKIVDLGKKGIFEMLRTFDGSDGDFINERNQSLISPDCTVSDNSALSSSCLFIFLFFYVLPLTIIGICYFRVLLYIRHAGYAMTNQIVSRNRFSLENNIRMYLLV